MKRDEIIMQQQQMGKVLLNDNNKTLVFRDKFSVGWCIFWLIFTGIGAAIYVLYYYNKPKTYIKYK